MLHIFESYCNSFLSEKTVKRDRCLRKADSVYGKKTSAYKSGAVVRCRKGKIWKKKKTYSETYQMIMDGFEKEEKEGLHGWFSRNKGTGWVDCRTGKTCGRQKGEKRKGYPACRPTMAMCNSRKRLKKGSKSISWKKGAATK